MHLDWMENSKSGVEVSKIQLALSIVQREKCEAERKTRATGFCFDRQKTFLRFSEYCVLFLDNFSSLPCTLTLLSFQLEKYLLNLSLV